MILTEVNIVCLYVSWTYWFSFCFAFWKQTPGDSDSLVLSTQHRLIVTPANLQYCAKILNHPIEVILAFTEPDSSSSSDCQRLSLGIGCFFTAASEMKGWLWRSHFTFLLKNCSKLNIHIPVIYSILTFKLIGITQIKFLPINAHISHFPKYKGKIGGSRLLDSCMIDLVFKVQVDDADTGNVCGGRNLDTRKHPDYNEAFVLTPWKYSKHDGIKTQKRKNQTGQNFSSQGFTLCSTLSYND